MDREVTDGAVDQNPPSAAEASAEHKFVITQSAAAGGDDALSSACSRWSRRTRGTLARYWLETVLAGVSSVLLAGVRESRAEGGSHYHVDDGILKAGDFIHGHYILTTKEAVPREIPVDDPEETITLTKKGSSIDAGATTNNASKMASFDDDYRSAYRTFSFGQQDSITQRDVQPQSTNGTNGSGGPNDGPNLHFQDNPVFVPPPTPPTGGPGGTGPSGPTTNPTDVVQLPPTAGVTKASLVDEDGLSGGNSGQNGDAALPSATANGVLVHTFGDEGFGTIDFAGLNGHAVKDESNAAVTSGGAALYYHWNTTTHTLSATTNAGTGGTEVFKVAINPANGAYTFTLEKPLDHPTADSQDTLTLDLGYTVRDPDSLTANGTLVLTVRDDMPTTGVTTTATLVDEDALPGGNGGQSGDAASPSATASGVLAHSFGADGPGDIEFAGLDGQAVKDAGNDAVTSGGAALYYHWNATTHTLSATTNSGSGGTEAFKVTVDPTTGDYTFTLEKPLDHPTADAQDTLTLNAGYTVHDKDGDTGTGTLVLTVRDDMPMSGVVTNASAVDEDALAGGNGGQSGDAATPSATATGTLATFGADGPGDIEFAGLDGHAVKDANNVAVTAGGAALYYHWNATTHTLTATTSSGTGGTEAFNVAVDPTTGAYTFTLDKPLDHPTTDTQDTLTLNVGYTVHDRDGDTGTDTLVLTVRDDMPTTGVTTTATLVDEDALAGGNSGQGGEAAASATAAGTLTHSFGADGPGDIDFADLDGLAVKDATNAAVKSGGAALYYHWDSSTDTLTAMTSSGTGGAEIFKVVVDPTTGDYTFTLEEPIDHPTTDTQDTLTINAGYTVRDHDGDTGTGTLVLTVRDDMPTTGVTTAATLVDEDALPGGNSGQGGEAAASATATGTLTHSFGADGPGDIDFAGLDGLAVKDATNAAVKSGGAALYYHWDSSTDTLTATTSSGTGGAEIFKVVVDPTTGDYTFTLEKPIDHPTTDTQDTLTLNAGYTVRDHDGDTGTGTLVLTVRDDMPTTGVTTTATLVDEDALPGGNSGQGGEAAASATATGTLTHSFGADGPGDIDFAGLDGQAVTDSNNAAVTAGAAALYYHWNTTTHTLTATTSPGSGGTEAFNVAIDPTTGDYRFTLEKPLDHPTTDTQDTLTLNAGYTVRDHDGDTGTGTLVLTVRDDMPTTGVTTTATLADAVSAAASGVLVHAFGADGAGGIDFAGLDGQAVKDTGNAAIKSGGAALFYHWNAATHTLSATTSSGSNGTEAFELVVDPTTGAYTLTLETLLDHPTSAPLALNLGYGVHDKDGDSGTGTLALTVEYPPLLSASETDGNQKNVDFVLANFGDSVKLNITASDPSGGAVTVTLTNVQSNVTFTDDHHDTLTVNNGTLTLTQSELQGLTLHTPNQSELISLTVTAQNVSNGLTTTAPETLDVLVSPQIAEWKFGISGAWSTAFFWNGGGAQGPTAQKDALIDKQGVLGPYTVLIDSPTAVAHSLTLSANATVFDPAGNKLTLTGELTIAKGSFALLGGDLSASSILVESSGKLTGFGDLHEDIHNLGVVESSGGVLALWGQVSGSGELVIDSNTTLDLHAADSNDVHFLNNFGTTGTLLLEDSDSFSGTIFNFADNFGFHDVIDLRDVNLDAPGFAASYDAGTHVLTVTDGTDTAHLKFAGSFSIANFQFSHDGSGGTRLVDPPAGEPATASSPASYLTFDPLGNETFVFKEGFGNVNIAGFSNSGNSIDKIQLENFADIREFSQLEPLIHPANNGQDTVIDLGHGDTITLVNVAAATLHPSDFIIHHG